LVVVLILASLLASCQGYTPPPDTLHPAATHTPTPARTHRVTLSPAGTTTPAPSPASTQVPVSTLDVTAADLKGAKIQFWFAENESVPSQGGVGVMQQMVERFNRENTWGITVELAAYPDYPEVYEKLRTYIYGDLPDLVLLYDDQASRLNAAGDLVVDLSSYVQDPVWGLTTGEQSDFYPQFWAASTGVKRTGAPFYRSAQVLLYNQTWAAELGFDGPPSDPSEFKDQACQAAKANREDDLPENDGTGGWVVDTDTATLAAWLMAYGGEIANPGESRGYAFDSAETRQALTFLKGLYDEQCAWVSAGRYPNVEFAGRRALFINSSVSGLPFQVDAFLDTLSSDQWTVLPYPSPGDQPVIYTYGPSFVVMKSSPVNQLAAWLLARWLLSPENQALWTESHGTLPVRLSVTSLLASYAGSHPQWAAALELVPYARNAPSRPSWDVVRWVLNDAGKQLFSPAFTASQIPELIDILSDTATEMDQQFR